MAEAIPAVYENGVLRPLQPLGLQDQQQVYVLVISEDLDTLALSQQEALTEFAGIGNSGHPDISKDHDLYLYRKG
jgi:predicted DNA-binding antitoxin AbrB/MazE fold protein